jgi:hypothetical protein
MMMMKLVMVVRLELVAGPRFGRILELLQPHVQFLEVHHTLQRWVFGVHGLFGSLNAGHLRAVHRSRPRLTAD